MAIVRQRADVRAFSTLVDRWQERVYRLLLRLTGNVQDAEDATQEVLAKLFSRRDQFRSESKFSTWLWRIAINTGNDTNRKRRPERIQTESISNDGPVSAALHSERREQVRTALAALPEQLRTVVVLRHYEQLKFREIAETLQIPTGTVASRMAAALNELGELLKQDDKANE